MDAIWNKWLRLESHSWEEWGESTKNLIKCKKLVFFLVWERERGVRAALLLLLGLIRRGANSHQVVITRAVRYNGAPGRRQQLVQEAFCTDRHVVDLCVCLPPSPGNCLLIIALVAGPGTWALGSWLTLFWVTDPVMTPVARESVCQSVFQHVGNRSWGSHQPSFGC